MTSDTDRDREREALRRIDAACAARWTARTGFSRRSRASAPRRAARPGRTPSRSWICCWLPAQTRLLLAHGADATTRTRIDDCETSRDVAARAGHRDIAELLAQHEPRRDPGLAGESR